MESSSRLGGSRTTNSKGKAKWLIQRYNGHKNRGIRLSAVLKLVPVAKIATPRRWLVGKCISGLSEAILAKQVRIPGLHIQRSSVPRLANGTAKCRTICRNGRKIYESESIPMSFPEQSFCRVYVGKANPQLKGNRCRILQTWRGKGPHNVLVEFCWGEKIMCPMRCLRKARP